MKNKHLLPDASQRFALMALAGCASLSSLHAAQTLRYNFESVTNPATDPVTNLAAGATVNGLFVNPDKISIATDQEVQVNAVRYLLGKSIDFLNVDNEEASAGHVDSGQNPSGWGMANNNTMNRSYTAMAWVKFGSTAGDNMVFGQLSGDALHLGSRNGNLHSGHWGDDLGPDQGINVPTGTGVWQHIAWVNNGNTQSVFRNGVEVIAPGAGGAGGGSVASMLLGSFRNNGSFVGSVDEVKIFGDQALTAVEIQTQMTNTLTAVPLAAVTSAKLTNAGFTFTLKDFVPNSIVNPASVTLEIDGANVTPTSSVKSGDITTVTYVPPVALGSTSSHVYVIGAKDQSNPAQPNITGTGTLLMPVLPVALPGPAGTTSTWGLREFRAGAEFGGNFNNNFIGTAVDALVALPASDPDPGTNDIFDTTAPVMNHTDPDQPGSLGNFNNDLPYPGHAAGVPDNNIVTLGKTSVVIPAAGPYTLSVHSDDGFALRIRGGPANNTSRFISSNRGTATNGIDPSDSQTIFFTGGTGDSNTTGVYEFSAAGTYNVDFVSFDGAGGSFYEVAFAPGSFRWDYQTTTWNLVGNPTDATVLAVPFIPRFITSLPGPAGTANNFGIRVFTSANSGGSAIGTSNWLRENAPNRTPDDVSTFDLQRNFLNLSDNRDGSGVLQNQGHVGNDDALPGSLVNQDNVITTAKGRVVVGTSATYTFNARGDDGFMLRIKAVTGPNPLFSRVTHPGANDGNPGLEMSNRNEIFYRGGTGDSQTRGIITLPAGQYDIEYFHWEGGGGFWYELTAAIGEFPHGNEPSTGWLLVGSNTPPPPAASQPNISAAGWNVESTAPGTLPSFNIAGALSSLAAGATTSQWDSVSFTDPQNGGGPATIAAISAWPRNTLEDDGNYAMRATGALVVPVAATYQLGYQGDDGGYLIIRGTGGNPNPSFDPTLVSNLTNAGVVEAEDPTNAPSVLNKLRTEVGTGNSQTIGRIALTPGTYQLEGLVYEGGGGSFWRVVGGIEPLAQEGVWLPLSKGGNVAVRSMLPLIAQPVETIVVTNFTLNAATGAYSLTFGSVAGANYQLEYSTAMEAGAAGSPTTWNIAPGASIAGSAGSTTITGNLTELQAANGGFLPPGSPRVFLRVRRL